MEIHVIPHHTHVHTHTYTHTNHTHTHSQPHTHTHTHTHTQPHTYIHSVNPNVVKVSLGYGICHKIQNTKYTRKKKLYVYFTFNTLKLTANLFCIYVLLIKITSHFKKKIYQQDIRTVCFWVFLMLLEIETSHSFDLRADVVKC